MYFMCVSIKLQYQLTYSGLQFTGEAFVRLQEHCTYLQRASQSLTVWGNPHEQEQQHLPTVASRTQCFSNSGKYFYIWLCALLFNQLQLAVTSVAECGWLEPQCRKWIGKPCTISHIYSFFSLPVWPRDGDPAVGGVMQFHTSEHLTAVSPGVPGHWGALSLVHWHSFSFFWCCLKYNFYSFLPALSFLTTAIIFDNNIIS